MAISYDEYINKNKKKKKKEEPKVVLGYSPNQNNVKNTPRSTTDTQTLIDRYIAEQKAKGDIAPVKKKEGDGLFSAFEDGYQMGDVSKTILKGGKKLVKAVYKTGKEIVTNPVESFKSGMVGIGEGINKANELTNDAVEDFFDFITGRKEEDKDLSVSIIDMDKFSKTASEEEKQKVLKEYEKKYGKDSALYKSIEVTLNTKGKKEDKNVLNMKYYDTDTYEKAVEGKLSEGQQNIYNIGQTVGNIVPATVVSAVLSPAVGKALFFTQAQQGYTEEALARGYDEKDARIYGMIMGGFEVAVERLGFDELGGFKGLAKGNIIKNMVGEGMEEFVMPYIDDVVTYVGFEDGYGWEEFRESSEEALEGAVMGAVVGGIFSAGGKGLAKVDKVIQKATNGETITQYELIEARDQLQEHSPETLQEAIVGVAEQLKNTEKLGGGKQEEVQDVTSEDIAPVPNETDIIENLQENNIPILEGNEYQQASTTETTVEADETALKSQNYVYQASETDSEYRRNLNEDASKYANNTTRTHEFVNTLANVSEASGLNIRLTNNTSPEMTQRKQAMINSYAKRNNVSVQEASERLKNIVIDGYNVNDQITINVNSPKALNRLVGHEITHSLEKTVVYKTKLQKIAIDYAKSKNDYKSRLDRLIDLYEGQNADINKELTADIIGDYLFTDQKFVDNLYKKDRNLFQRIYDEIKHLFKMATAGSKEARELEKLKHSFEKAMRENKEMSKESKKATVQETKDKSSVEVESNTQEKEDSVQKTEKTETSNVTESVEAETKTEDKTESKIEENVEEYSLSDVDSEGNKLSEEQIEFFKKSVVRDENGNLIVVYHTMTNEGTQFNEFNPVGTGGYRFGDQVVIYFTDSKEMSGSYAGFDKYKMADTQKITSLAEARQLVESMTDGEVKIKKQGDKYQLTGDKNKVKAYEEAKAVYDTINYSDKSFMHQLLAHSGMNTTSRTEQVNDFFKVIKGYQELNLGLEYIDINLSEDAKDYFAGMIGHNFKVPMEVYKTYDNEEQLLRNIRADVDYLVDGESKFQYEGYLNITNPYIVEANGGNWDEISQEFSENIKIRFESLTAEERESLIKLSSQGKLATRPVLEKAYENTSGEGFSYYGTKYSSEDAKNLASAYVKLKEGVGMTPTYDSIYSVAEQRFKQMWIESASVVNYTTNDIVKRVIEDNKHGSNYDGVIIREVTDYGFGRPDEADPNDVYVVFNSNQFKAKDNKNPTEDSDIRYSLSESTTDSEGKELSKEQVEFFKDSKVRDIQGRLLKVYHGTEYGGFNVFNSYNDMTWVTPVKEYAEAYTDFGYAEDNAPQIYTMYANITNPVYVGEINDEVNDNTLNTLSKNTNISKSELKQIADYIRAGAVYDITNSVEFRNLAEKSGYDGIEAIENGHKSYATFNSNQIKNVDNTNPTENDDIRYSLSDNTDKLREQLLVSRDVLNDNQLRSMKKVIAESKPNFFSKNTDNLGRKLSKGMKEYMKDSKARDINDSLTTVYHTTTNEVTQFNEFNPVGTDGYRFGDQVVNYYTDSKFMSGSYAEFSYDMAKTKKLNSMEDAEKWLEDNRFATDRKYEYEIKTTPYGAENVILYEYDSGKLMTVFEFQNESDLLRNLQEQVKRVLIRYNQRHNIQYEGYVNITNPYVVDAEGRGWKHVGRKFNDNKQEDLNKITSDQDKVKALEKLANDSWKRHEEYDFSGDEWTYYHYRNTADALKGKELNEAVQFCAMFNFEYNAYAEGLEGLPSGDSTVTDLTTDLTDTNYNMFKDMTLSDFVRVYAQEYEKNLLYGREESYFKHEYKNITGELKELPASDLYKIARKHFTEDSITDAIAEYLSTNDIVHKVIEMNKNGSNYDGVIMKNVIDYGTGMSREEALPNDLYITFNSNQFKAWDNENPTDDPDIRYSLSVDDYGMSHRPSTDYGDGSNFEENMPDVFEHPEWYFFGSDARSKKAYRESLEALRKVRNNPEGEITIYRATIGDSINEGDWVTPSKTYAEWHNDSQFDGKANIIELKVKAKDIRFAGDDLNEFGYFPNGTDNFSLSRIDDIAPVGENDIFGKDIAVQEQVKEAIAPLQEQIETLTKTISDLQENMAPASFDLAEEQRAETQRTMTDEDAPLTDEGTFSFLDEEVKVKKKSEIINDIASDFNIKKTEARELYNKIESIPEVTIDDVYTELENYRKVKFKEQDDYVKSIQDYIRGTKLDISNIKKQIPDYGNVYRMSNMGKGLILGNSGQGVDTFYQELNELFPNEFPSDVVAEADQLELISQAMYKEKEFTYVDILDDDELQILAERIYTDIGNSERYKHTQSGLYFLNREVKKMAPPGEINTNISEEEYADSLSTLDASNTEQVEETVSLEEELNELDRQKGPSIKKNPFDEVLDKFLEGQRPGKTTTTPKVEKTKYENFRDATQRLFVNEMVESDNLAKESGNLNIKYTGDMLNNVAGEIEGEIYTAQTDNEGHQIGKSLSALFSEAKKTGLYDAFNDYLEQYSNIDRHAQGKGSVVPLADSQRLVRHYEKTYPEFKQWGKGVWQYGANIRNNLIDAGLINEEFAETLGTMYPHYVPYMEDREMTNYNPDLGEIKPKGVIKRAKGGADNLLPIEEALTKYTFASKKAVRQNQFYQEIVSTLDSKAEVGADVRSDALDLEDTLYRDETGNYLTAYFDGERLSVRISDDLYTGLRNDLKGQIKGLEEKFALITDPVQKLSEWRRNLLTSWNPMFIIKNPIMDVQDALFNSKYTKDFAKNYPKAFVELGQAKSETAKQFLTLYGSGNVMGEYNSDGSVKSNKFLRGIERANNIMELAPRYAEFKASLENGASLQEAMYNAREVTTNFGRGGVITKALNKNGFTFLNVSVQGFDKFIRNFSGENGAKGVTGALLKATLLGVIPAVFNELAFGGDDEEKDEDYDALPDYIKDNYYLIKTGDGQFIRIPKGRILSVFGSAGRRTIEYLQGEEDAFEGYLKNANSQIGISNPLDSNILTPLFQAFGSENGEAWYGGDIVPTRLQSKAPREQYDASTDKFSIWLGDKIGVSPYKINYVIDQYSGGMGDIFLPFITEESTSDAEGIELALAPIKDQFTANSTFDNKYAGDIYDLSDKMDKMPSSVKETDEYKIQDAYLYSVTSEMGKLYAERRAVQENKELSKKEKYEKVQEIQKQINALAKEGLDNYENVNSTSNYAIVGGREFNKYKTESGETRWGAVREEELEALNSYGLDIMEKSSYFNAKTYISQAQEKYKDTEDYTQKKRDIIAVIKSTLLTDEAKAYLYDKYYADSETLNTITSLGIDFDKYLDLEYQNFEADKNSAGKSISGSKKAKVFRYINSMDLSFEEKLVLTKLQYNSYNEHNGTVINYINSADLTYEQRVNILKKLGFKVDDYGNIKW